MKFLNKSLFLALMASLVFIACTEDNIDDVVAEDPAYEPDVTYLNETLNQIVTSSTENGAEFECLLIAYPFEFELASGATIEVNSNADYYEVVGDTNTTDPIIDFVYPLPITGPDGSITEVTTIEELALLYVYTCVEDTTGGGGAGGLIECTSPAHGQLFMNQGEQSECGYYIEFPVELTAEGVTYQIEDMDDYLELYNQYSNQLDAIDIVYPISVSLGSDITVEFLEDDEICTFIYDC